MLVMEDDCAVMLACEVCGGPIMPGQPYIMHNDAAVHSESEDCDPEEGWNPHMEIE